MCGCGRGVVFELSENSGQLAGRVGDHRDKRSGRRFRAAGLWHLVRVLALGFRGVSVLVLYQKANKRWQAERAKTARKTATKKRKNPDKIKTFPHFSIDK